MAMRKVIEASSLGISEDLGISKGLGISEDLAGSETGWISEAAPIEGASGHEIPPGFRHFLEVPPTFATFHGLWDRPADRAGTSAESSRPDEPIVAADGCQAAMAGARRCLDRKLGKPVHSLGLHLSAAVRGPRSRALRDTALGGGQPRCRDLECASHGSQA